MCRKGIHCTGDWFPAFWTQMVVRMFFLYWLIPKYLLFQNNQYGKGAHFRAACHCPLYKLRKIELVINHSTEIRSLEPSPSTAPHRFTFWRLSRSVPTLGYPFTEQIEGDQNFLWLPIPSLNGRCSLFARTQHQILAHRDTYVWVPKCLSLSFKSMLLLWAYSGPCFHLWTSLCCWGLKQ